MSIDHDIRSLQTVPMLRLLGDEALRVLAIGAETRDADQGETLFHAGDRADCAYIIQRGGFRVIEDGGADVVAGPGAILGELALIIDMRRPGSAVAVADSTVMRISRSLFQKVLESFPDAAERLRADLVARTAQVAQDIERVAAQLANAGKR